MDFVSKKGKRFVRFKFSRVNSIVILYSTISNRRCDNEIIRKDENHVMGFCRICFIVYMLCTCVVRTERNCRSQHIIVLKILICVYSCHSYYFSADLRAKHQGILCPNVFRENNYQIYFAMGYIYGCGSIRILLLFVYSRSKRI